MGFWERSRWLNKVEAIGVLSPWRKKRIPKSSNVNHIVIPKLRVSSPRFQGSCPRQMELRRKNAVSEPMDGCGAVWLDPEIPYVFFSKISGECHKKNGTLFVATIYSQFQTCFRFVKYTVPQGVCMLYQSWVGWAPLLGEVYPAIGPDNFKAAWWLLWKTFCVPWIWRVLKQQSQISSQFKYWMWYRNHRKIFWSLMFLKVFCWNFRCR